MSGTDSLHIEDGSLLRYCQRMNRIETRRLRFRHMNGEGGFSIAASRSIHIDRLLQTIHQTQQTEFQPVGSSSGSRISGVWIALGEYGCLELSPRSAVDLLILLKANQKTAPEETLEEIRLILESSGIHLQVTVATPKECLHRALNSFSFGIKLLSARYIIGDASHFKDLIQRFRANVLKNPLSFVFEITEFLKGTHENHGQDIYRVDSDLTLGAGGLLDGQTFLGCLRILTGTENPERLLEERHLSPRDWTSLQRARELLLRIRNSLHFSTGIGQDILPRDGLEGYARFLGYGNSQPRVAVIQFLREML